MFAVGAIGARAGRAVIAALAGAMASIGEASNATVNANTVLRRFAMHSSSEPTQCSLLLQWGTADHRHHIHAVTDCYICRAGVLLRRTTSYEEKASAVRVLLLSPVRALDPPNGDVTYTEELVRVPPSGVTYVTYDQALADGTLTPVGWRSARRPTEAIIGVANSALNLLRRRGLMFREPFCFYRMRPGIYDLVHCHVFSARLLDVDCPVVVSNAAPIEHLYRYADQWPESRTRMARTLDYACSRMLGVTHNTYGARGAARLICFTDWLKRWYVANSTYPSDRIDVVPCSVDVPDQPRASPPARVGFVGLFSVKGGDTVLLAWDKLIVEHPDWELLMITDRPSGQPDQPSVRWTGRVSREKLIGELLPSLSVLAYPTRFDGLPLTLLETLALGVPVAASDFGAMPEILSDGGGLIGPTDDADTLAHNVRILMAGAENDEHGAAGRENVRAQYETSVTRKLLLDVYLRALRESRGMLPLGNQ